MADKDPNELDDSADADSSLAEHKDNISESELETAEQPREIQQEADPQDSDLREMDQLEKDQLGKGQLENDQGESEQQTVDVEPSSKPSSGPAKKGRGLVWFTLLLTVAALAGVGYLYYQLVYLDPLSSIKQDIQREEAADDGEISALKESLQQQESAIAERLKAAQETQATTLAETQAGILDSLQETLLAAPPSEREWKLAEAEYLLRIGNHRVLMEQDTRGALELFLAVDQILAELDDFAFHQVRAVLADEIIALRQVPRTDTQGVYLRLEAIKSNLDSIVFKVPEYVRVDPETETEATVWQQLEAQLKEFVRVRRVGGDEITQPLLTPSEEQYLELNLRLALEQAQLAALKQQQAVFETALQNVRDWLLEYTDDSESLVQAEIEPLLELQLSQPLPNVANSLNELRNARAGAE